MLILCCDDFGTDLGYVVNDLYCLIMLFYMFLLTCFFYQLILEESHFSLFILQVRGSRGPIFEDGPNFDSAFKLFHGKDGVVPLSERSWVHNEKPEVEAAPIFNPLAAKAATISLSAFGPGGPFSFESFSQKWKNQKKKPERSRKENAAQVCRFKLYAHPSGP